MAGAVTVSRSSGVARVTVLDVGQGDAILVEGSRGGRLLIDGGPDPARLMVVLDGRIPPWDRRIDARHPHATRTRITSPGSRGCWPGTGSGGSSSRGCAGRAPATPSGCAV